MLLALLRFDARRTVGRAGAGAFAVGLALSNQHTAVFFGAPFALWALLSGRTALLRPAPLLLLAAAGLAGLSPYLYLVARGGESAAWGSWGETSTAPRSMSSHTIELRPRQRLFTPPGADRLAASSPTFSGSSTARFGSQTRPQERACTRRRTPHTTSHHSIGRVTSTDHRSHCALPRPRTPCPRSDRRRVWPPPPTVLGVPFGGAAAVCSSDRSARPPLLVWVA